MWRIALLFTALFLSTAAFTESDLQQKVNRLDSQSRDILGVSIFAVAELVKLEKSPHFIPIEYATGSGELEHLRELEAMGYVKIDMLKGLPDGTMKDQEFLWVIRTDEGEHLASCFKEAQHNNQIEQGTR